MGLAFAFTFGIPYPKFNKKLSKYLLQASVVGLGFGMNLQKSLQSGADGMLFTIISVIGVMIIRSGLGKIHADRPQNLLPHLLRHRHMRRQRDSSRGGVLKANENEMAVSLGVIFILNAIALFIFPTLGHLFDLSQAQFGTWAAIAIHDTSSVVGAGEAYGAEACELATLIKCTRALWIIPSHSSPCGISEATSRGEGKAKISIPWFILLFVVAMVIYSYTPPQRCPSWARSTRQ